MPQDTISIDNKGSFMVIPPHIEIDSSILIDALKISMADIPYSYNEKNTADDDSVFKVLTKDYYNKRNTVYSKEKQFYNELGIWIIGFIFFFFILLIIYAIKKRNAYIKDPDAAEAKEKWEEIGTSNNYDTTGDGWF